MKPQYEKLKCYITSSIDEGIWQVGEKVCSEYELADQFGVSRMTANRALRELTGEGLLERVPGVGTFVAEHVPQVPLFEIRNIADEIRDRGNEYSSELCLLERVSASNNIAIALGQPVDVDLFHSIMVHHENGVPVQLEDRYVAPALAPEYIDQDFTVTTPNEYLMKVVPITEAEHVIEAILPDPHTQARLKIGEQEPCLLLHRRTWSGNTVATIANLIHPSRRYRLGSRFTPSRLPAIKS